MVQHMSAYVYCTIHICLQYYIYIHTYFRQMKIFLKMLDALLMYAFMRFCEQVDVNDRRSRRDMSPQGRRRAGMLGRDCRTVSGIGQSYYNSQVSYVQKNPTTCSSVTQRYSPNANIRRTYPHESTSCHHPINDHIRPHHTTTIKGATPFHRPPSTTTTRTIRRINRTNNTPNLTAAAAAHTQSNNLHQQQAYAFSRVPQRPHQRVRRRNANCHKCQASSISNTALPCRVARRPCSGTATVRSMTVMAAVNVIIANAAAVPVRRVAMRATDTAGIGRDS